MNKVKKNLVMQDLIVHCHLAKRSNNSPIQSKENQMEEDSTSFEEFITITCVKTMEERNDS